MTTNHGPGGSPARRPTLTPWLGPGCFWIDRLGENVGRLLAPAAPASLTSEFAMPFPEPFPPGATASPLSCRRTPPPRPDEVASPERCTPIPATARPKSTLNPSGALPLRTKIDRPAGTTGSIHEASTSSVTFTSPDASGNVLPGARLTDTPRCWSEPTV